MSVDALRSLSGKANHISNVLYSWRPFLSDFWGAINTLAKHTAPKGGIWLKQVLPDF